MFLLTRFATLIFASLEILSCIKNKIENFQSNRAIQYSHFYYIIFDLRHTHKKTIQ